MYFDKQELDSVIEYTYKNFGQVGICVNELMDAKGISVNQMSGLTDVQHRIVKKYYEQKAIRADFEVLAKFCFVLKCDISDILYYLPPVKKESEN